MGWSRTKLYLKRGLIILFYATLFGTPLPGAARVSRIVRRWEIEMGVANIPASKKVWEQQYENQFWAYMRKEEETERYRVLVEQIHRLKQDPSILDVGCGEGILMERMRHLSYERYLGLDISETAIARAAPLSDARTRFLCRDAAVFAPEERFDVVVFNESLYYFDDPIAVLRSYESCLAEGGIFLSSMFHSRRSLAVRRLLLRNYRLLEEFESGNGKNTWTISAFVPRANLSA